MALTNKSLTHQIHVRCTEDLYDAVQQLKEGTEMSEAGAARVLMERGSKQLGPMEMKDLRVVYFNAKADALRTLEQAITESIDEWREEEI